MAKFVPLYMLATCVVALTSAAFPIVAAPAPAPTATTPPAKLSKWQQHKAEVFKDAAPGDEYFGRTKLSFLGMNNIFHDAAISSGDHTTDAAIAHKVADAEDALDAWAKKYPHDPQLARTYYLATIVERKIWLQANQRRAWDYLSKLEHGFADTYFGKTAKKSLAIGFTEHYYAPAETCASPAPAQSPQPVTTTVGPGHKVQVLPQACIPAPTPAPSAAPAESPSAAPAESPTESPAATPAPVPSAT